MMGSTTEMLIFLSLIPSSINSQMDNAQRNSQYSYKIHIIQYVYDANSKTRDNKRQPYVIENEWLQYLSSIHLCIVTWEKNKWQTYLPRHNYTNATKIELAKLPAIQNQCADWFGTQTCFYNLQSKAILHLQERRHK